MRVIRILLIILLIVAVGAVAYWYISTQRNSPVTSLLSGSGTVEATSVIISPEIFGRISEVLVNEGSQVQSGDVLFKLDEALLTAQLKQAEANLNAAKEGVGVANESYTAAISSVDIAQAQYNLALVQALQAAQPGRSSAWQQSVPSNFNQPVWYFSHTELRKAAQDELNSSRQDLVNEQANLDALKASSDFANLVATEERLALARASFLDAQDVLDRAQQQSDQALIDAVQKSFDDAMAELDGAQNAYDDLLDSKHAQDILEARARLTSAQERFDTAQDRYNALQTGNDSPQVLVAAAALAQAQSNATLANSKVTQAQAMVDQAQAAIDLLHVQMAKLVITAPVPGVVLTSNIQPGEVIQPGASALTLSELDHLSITVFIPENRYGEVNLGDTAQVKVDSFPDQAFSATVTRIADQAEFTPRNVQTMEGRSSTVFAVELAVQDPGGSLKPGMPADVTFTQH